MTSYSVKGRYLFKGKKNPFDGEFQIEGENILGYIKDKNSLCPRHEVRGKIYSLDDNTILEFVKIPTGMLANIFYRLKKTNVTKSINGKYKGFWSFKEETFQAILLESNTTPESGVNITAVAVPETETENKADLTLDSLI